MIKVKLQEIAHKLAKNSSEIARETGINRNTINALMHDKVDGLKFPTIEKLCQTYGLGLTDLIEYHPETPMVEPEMQNMVRQEAPLVLFYMWPWVVSLGHYPAEFFDHQYSRAYIYMKGGHGQLYQPLSEMNQMATAFYRKNSDAKRLDAFMAAFESIAREGEKLYLDSDPKQIIGLSKNELVDYFNKFWQAITRLWKIGQFHECFEAGFERETIRRIAQAKHLTDEEVVALSAMDRPSFHDERRLAMIKLTRSYLAAKPGKLEDFLREDQRAKGFIKEFGYYKNTSGGPQSPTIEELAIEMDKYIKDKAYLEKEYRKLVDWQLEHDRQVAKILQRHRLKTNPLYFFSRMAYLRERRKQVFSMLVSVGGYVLSSVEKQTGIDRKYLNFLNHEEISGVLKGLINQEMIKGRAESHLLLEESKDEYRLLMGAEADSVHQELEGKVNRGEGSLIIPGSPGAQGYAKGLARVVKSRTDLLGLKEGEILVLSSMKQEYLGLVSKAAGFIVEDADPAGLAIKAAHEWGKPCLIKVQDATSKISTGDMVDLRANHRSIKVIKK